MKQFFVAAAAAILLVTAGCHTAPLAPPTSEVVLLQGDATLDASYNVAAKLYLAALPTMKPAVHDRTKPLLIRAYSLVNAVDTGTLLAGETSMAGQISEASNLIGEVKAALQP